MASPHRRLPPRMRAGCDAARTRSRACSGPAVGVRGPHVDAGDLLGEAMPAGLILERGRDILTDRKITTRKINPAVFARPMRRVSLSGCAGVQACCSFARAIANAAAHRRPIARAMLKVRVSQSD